jgi:hypothetical protein
LEPAYIDQRAMPAMRRLLVPIEWLIALVILFEEWGWEPIQQVMEQLARRPAVAALERRVASLPPQWALLVFVLPSVVLLPVNVLGLWLTGEGQALAGTTLIVGAKLVSTSLVARVFTLTRPALLQMGWFATVCARWQRWSEALLAPVRASWVWRMGREMKRRWAAFRSLHADGRKWP